MNNHPTMSNPLQGVPDPRRSIFVSQKISRYKQYTTEGADPAQFCYDSYINSR